MAAGRPHSQRNQKARARRLYIQGGKPVRKLLWLVVVLFLVGGVAWVNRPMGKAAKAARPLTAEVLAARKALLTPAAKKLIAADNDFALRLFAALLKQKPRTNLCLFAPGVAQPLRLCRLGSAGQTERELAKVLGAVSPKPAMEAAYVRDMTAASASVDPAASALGANCLWVERRLAVKPAFADLLRKGGGVEIRNVDLRSSSTRGDMRRWYSDHTGGKIDSVGSAPTSDTGMVFTDAVSFEGRWSAEFDPALTRDAPFVCFDGKFRDVPLMHIETKLQSNWNFGSGVNLRVPYGRGDQAMYLLLSDEKTAIDKVVNDLRKTTWSKFRGGFGPAHTEKLALPRFKTNGAYDLKGLLKSLGLKTALDMGRADFTGINDQYLVWLQSINQKTVISVDEKGTQAASGTEQGFGCAKSLDCEFTRPFVYLVADDSTGAVLFIGVFGTP